MEKNEIKNIMSHTTNRRYKSQEGKILWYRERKKREA
jgi:hypothetical protein